MKKTKQLQFVLYILIFSLFLTNYSYASYYLEGVGVSLEINTTLQYPQIRSVIPNSPAYRANFNSGDLITEINGVSTYSSTIDNIVAKLKGKKGTVVSIILRRGTNNYPIKLKRDKFLDIDQSSRTFYIQSYALPKFSSFTWSGDVVNNYADGYGKLQLINDDGSNGTYYVGYMKNGELSGEGVYYYATGERWYQGTFEHNQLNGWGYKFYNDGSVQYEGNFLNDELYIDDDLQNSLYNLADAIVTKVFHGGDNIKAKITRQRRIDSNRPFSRNNMTIRVGVSFNGNIVSSNYYEFCIELKSNEDGYEVISMNNQAKTYLENFVTAKMSIEVIRFLESLKS